MGETIEKFGDVLLKTEIVDDGDPEIENIKDAQNVLSDSRMNELKTAFSLLDKNKDGCVSLSEMKAMMCDLGIDMQECVVEALIKQANERGDGLISEEEFLGWMSSLEEIRGEEDDIMEDLLAAFRVFDKDGNGFITKDELRTAMDLIGESVTEAELDEMLKASDIDHDGKINYEEFVKILM